MWWSCNLVRGFWSNLHKEVQKILHYDLPKNPENYLLGLNLNEIDVKDRVCLWYIVVAARQLYARNWKSDNTPIEEWRQLLLKYAKLDKLTKKLDAEQRIHTRMNKEYIQDWGKVKIYFKNIKNYVSYVKNFEIF